MVCSKIIPGSTFTIFFSSLGGQAAFHVFLKSEFCDENLEFWLACEELKSITNPEDLTYRAIAIYEEFIRKDAPKEVTELNHGYIKRS